MVEAKPIETPKKPELTQEQIANLIVIVSTHPTPQGVGSQEGQYKIQLINTLHEIQLALDNH